MSTNIRLNSATQEFHVDPGSGSVTLIYAGPPGPSGSMGDAAVAVAAHNNAEQVHTNATSGRDFSAYFLLEMT